MQALNPGERKLTELDHARLTKIAAAAGTPGLDDLLVEADVLASRAIPADVVTMYAQVVVRDVLRGERQTLVLCYPCDAEPAGGFISVLSPAGLALLGLPVGALAKWAVPGGRETTVRIEGLLFQPEATGDYVT